MSPEKHYERMVAKAQLDTDSRIVEEIFERRSEDLRDWLLPIYTAAGIRAEALLGEIAARNEAAAYCAKFAGESVSLCHFDVHMNMEIDRMIAEVVISDYHGRRTEIEVPAVPMKTIYDGIASSIEAAVDVAIANFAQRDGEGGTKHWSGTGVFFAEAADRAIHPSGGYVWARTFHPLLAREYRMAGWPHGPLPSHVRAEEQYGHTCLTNPANRTEKIARLSLGGHLEKRPKGHAKRDPTLITVHVPDHDANPGALVGMRLVDLLPLDATGEDGIDSAVASLMIEAHEHTWPAERQFPVQQSYRLNPASHIQAAPSGNADIDEVASKLARAS